ncbi:MAG: hypothetical protein ACLUZ6_06985 [Lachnospira eligens]
MHLLVIPMFVLDFLCMHPFNDGNGRISQITDFIAAVSGQDILWVSIYSIEKLIEQTKETILRTVFN